MDRIAKLLRKEEEKENRTLKILLKIFLIVGIVAGICVIAKIVYDKFKKDLNCFCDEDDCCFDDLLEDCDDCTCECECELTEDCEPCECDAPCTCEEPSAEA
jgi:hypothetical protein